MDVAGRVFRKYAAPMGQRSPTETLFGIVAAFIDRPTWTQAELARHLETRSETIRKHLEHLQAGGFKIERQEDHPHVYWSVPKNWMPGAIAFKVEEAPDLLRLLARSPRGKLRDRVLETAMARLARAGRANGFDPAAVQAPGVTVDEEEHLEIVEDAAAKKTALKMRYFSTSRRDESWRHVSVHRVDIGPRTQFVATCHKTNALKRFRVSNVLDARLDLGERFRPVTKEALAKFDAESFGGFRDEGPSVACAFFVRDPEAAWVAKNLPDERIERETVKGGARFTVKTNAVTVLARYVAGLGEVARPETPELRAEVAAIARAALANAT